MGTVTGLEFGGFGSRRGGGGGIHGVINTEHNVVFFEVG
jgi:hypothetical protein